MTTLQHHRRKIIDGDKIGQSVRLNDLSIMIDLFTFIVIPVKTPFLYVLYHQRVPLQLVMYNKDQVFDGLIRSN